jgi:hypothetical protein
MGEKPAWGGRKRFGEHSVGQDATDNRSKKKRVQILVMKRRRGGCPGKKIRGTRVVEGVWTWTGVVVVDFHPKRNRG